MVESFTNVDGSPSILRIETTGDAQKISIPPFVKVMREVTNEEYYETKVMAQIGYKMPESDKLSINHQLTELRKEKYPDRD